jgi:hypothetical protein
VLLTTGTMGKGPPRKNSLITAVKSIGAATGSPVWDSASLGSSNGWTAQTNARRGWNGDLTGLFWTRRYEKIGLAKEL